jgi:uncharacterized protein YndB with AHSA1/START domain
VELAAGQGTRANAIAPRACEAPAGTARIADSDPAQPRGGHHGETNMRLTTNATNAAAALVLVLAPVLPARAEVTAVGESGFEIRSQTFVRATPAEVYAALTRRIGRWWDPEHTYSGDARNMALQARPGGCFCERIPDHGAIEHMRVIYVSRNQVLRLSGGLGPLQESGLTGTLTWTLGAAESGANVVLDYRVGGFRPGGFAALAPLVGQVLEVQLQRLKRYVETGDPVAR